MDSIQHKTDKSLNRHDEGTPVYSSRQFKLRYFILICVAWTIPPIVGLGFCVFANIFSADLAMDILLSPPISVYLGTVITFSVFLMSKHVLPIAHYLDNPALSRESRAIEAMRRFSLKFWVLLLIYYGTAPSLVMLVVENFPSYVEQKHNWFFVHAVSFNTSIFVELPIYFIVLNLFGECVGKMRFNQSQVSIKTKMFLIATLTPLLADSIFVLYYLSRTEFYSYDTLVIWGGLELFAIAGCVIFIKSLSQSILPLKDFFTRTISLAKFESGHFSPQSVDELGIVTRKFDTLLQELNIHSEALNISNQLLRELEHLQSLPQCIELIIAKCHEVIELDLATLILYDPQKKALVSVAISNKPYNENGYFSLDPAGGSLSALAYNSNITLNVCDPINDDRSNRDIALAYNMKASLCTPLRCEGVTIGVLGILSNSKYKHFTRRDEVLLETFAKEASIAIQTQRLLAEKHQAEQERQKQDELIQLITESATEGIFGIDLDGKCRFINRSAIDMLGYHEESEFLNKPIYTLFFFPADEDYPIENYPQLFASHCSDCVAWRKNNSSFPIEYWSHPVMDNGKMVAQVVTFIDISERKKLDLELQQRRVELRNQVRNRTADIVRINKELESFSHTATHDLRTPLRAITGYSEILLQEFENKFDDQGKAYLKRIVSNTRQMGQLLDDLVKLNQVSRNPLKYSEINISELVYEMAKIFVNKYPDRKMELKIGDNLLVSGDPELIRTLIYHLLDNAWKFTTNDSTQPMIQVGKLCDSNGVVEFYIRDNGIGFEDVYSRKLFKGLYRVNNPNREFSTGIGLTLVKRIMDRHSGHIRIDSELGKGSTLYFSIPNAPFDRATQA